MVKLKVIKNSINDAIAHNNKIDDFINVTLFNHFGKDNLTFAEWLIANQMINEQKFVLKAFDIVADLQNVGIDAKVDAQSGKIYIPERYVRMYA